MILTQKMIDKLRAWELQGHTFYVGQTLDETRAMGISKSEYLSADMEVNVLWIAWDDRSVGEMLQAEELDKSFEQLLLLKDLEYHEKRAEKIRELLKIKGVA